MALRAHWEAADQAVGADTGYAGFDVYTGNPAYAPINGWVYKPAAGSGRSRGHGISLVSGVAQPGVKSLQVTVYPGDKDNVPRERSEAQMWTNPINGNQDGEDGYWTDWHENDVSVMHHRLKVQFGDSAIAWQTPSGAGIFTQMKAGNPVKYQQWPSFGISARGNTFEIAGGGGLWNLATGLPVPGQHLTFSVGTGAGTLEAGVVMDLAYEVKMSSDYATPDGYFVIRKLVGASWVTIAELHNIAIGYIRSDTLEAMPPCFCVYGMYRNGVLADGSTQDPSTTRLHFLEFWMGDTFADVTGVVIDPGGGGTPGELPALGSGNIRLPAAPAVGAAKGTATSGIIRGSGPFVLAEQSVVVRGGVAVRVPTGTQVGRFVIAAADGANLSGTSIPGPGTVVWESDEESLTAIAETAWAVFEDASPPTLEAGSYWLMLHTGDTGAATELSWDEAANGFVSGPDTYAGGAATPVPWNNKLDRLLSIFADFDPTGAGPPPPPGDTTAPELDPAIPPVLTGGLLVVPFTEPLDASSVPMTGVTVVVSGESRALELQEVVGGSFRAQVAGPHDAWREISVSYAPPVSGRLRDLASNEAAAFTNVVVHNLTATDVVQRMYRLLLAGS